MKNKYGYEMIEEAGSLTKHHYRIFDQNDDRIATCYIEEHAKFIVDRLNAGEFSNRNLKRCESPRGFDHHLSDWNLSEWMTATLGELGEAANVIKKLNRHRDGIKEEIPESELMNKLADELADTYIYLDLLFQAAGIHKQKAVEHKFQKTSEKIGYKEN